MFLESPRKSSLTTTLRGYRRSCQICCCVRVGARVSAQSGVHHAIPKRRHQGKEQQAGIAHWRLQRAIVIDQLRIALRGLHVMVGMQPQIEGGSVAGVIRSPRVIRAETLEAAGRSLAPDYAVVLRVVDRQREKDGDRALANE